MQKEKSWDKKATVRKRFTNTIMSGKMQKIWPKNNSNNTSNSFSRIAITIGIRIEIKIGVKM